MEPTSEQVADNLLNAAKCWQNGIRPGMLMPQTEEIRSLLADKDLLSDHAMAGGTQEHMDMLASAALSEVGARGFEVE